MQNDLFGLTVNVTSECFSSIYGSGASAYWDARGTIEAARPLGVVATEMPPATLHLLKMYAEQGGRVFIDSGAFTSFKRNVETDFEAILAVYDEVLDGLTAYGRQNIAIVMPDVIGNQSASLALLNLYRARIEGYIASGADVIIALHQGELPVQVVTELMVAMFGLNFRLGIPSNAAALADSDLARIKHWRFHILGKATLDAKLRRRAYTLLESNPGADLTCDANLIRTKLGEVSKTHKELIAECDNPFDEVFDDTELIYEVLHGSSWMKRSDVAQIASLYGKGDAVTIQRWVAAHRAGGLNALIEEVDPDGMLLYQMMPSMFDGAAKAMLSARLRGKAVASVLAA